MTLGSAWSARLAAAAAALWPLLFLWSAQLMKDTLSLFLFLLMVVMVIELTDVAATNWRWVRTGILGVALFATGLLLHTLRYYLVTGLLLSAVLAIALVALTRWREIRLEHAVVVCVLFLLRFA